MIYLSTGGTSPPDEPAVDDTTTAGRFAETGDLEVRWHALTTAEKAKAEALLDDASDLIRTTCPRWDTATPATLKRICCAVVKRAMLAGDDTAGVTQHSQTAGPYNESFTYSNPAGDLYLTQSEKASLGGDGTSWAYDLTGGAA